MISRRIGVFVRPSFQRTRQVITSVKHYGYQSPDRIDIPVSAVLNEGSKCPIADERFEVERGDQGRGDKHWNLAKRTFDLKLMGGIEIRSGRCWQGRGIIAWFLHAACLYRPKEVNTAWTMMEGFLLIVETPSPE